MIHRLVYVSDICEGYSNDLNKALDGARAYYAKHDITGALWFDGFHFIFLLEGPKKNLDIACKERLLPTNNSNNTKITDLGPTRKRAFSDWTMSYLCKGSHAHEIIRAQTGDTNFNPHNYIPTELADLLFALENDRRKCAQNAIN